MLLEHIFTYITLFTIIIIIGQLFYNTAIPISLILVITGMCIGFFTDLPEIKINPNIVLDIFLPILVYQISGFSSWKDFKKNLRPIALMSVGHVFFITILIAILMHYLIPNISWPLAFILGAIISPPDDVAIVSIAEKIRMPSRIITILEGEGLFNDAAALTLFKLALVAALTHQFSATKALTEFVLIVTLEFAYGIILGNILGSLRLKITNNKLNMIASLISPFLAYVPVVMLGGSGVLATATTGFVIGHRYVIRFSPEFRITSNEVWPTVSFAIQNLLFLLVGLNMEFIWPKISAIPLQHLILYSTAIILTVIIGRFIWVYVAVLFLPRFLFPSIREKDPYPPWQYPFVVSWAGMRGGISLAAAFAIPLLPSTIDGANPRDLFIFFVFCVIVVTLLLQGLTLPWLLNVIGIHKFSKKERYDEHLTELKARLFISKASLRWLRKHKMSIADDLEKKDLLEDVKLLIKEYRNLRNHLQDRIKHHHTCIEGHDETIEMINEAFILTELIEIERKEVLMLWKNEKISFVLRNKLIERLDHRAKHLLI